MKKKYLQYLLWCLFFIGIFAYIMSLIPPRSWPWRITSFIFYAIVFYWTFILTKCKTFLVGFFFGLFYVGVGILNYYGLEVGEMWKNIIPVAKWIFIILLLVVLQKEKEILPKRLKEMFKK